MDHSLIQSIKKQVDTTESSEQPKITMKIDGDNVDLSKAIIVTARTPTNARHQPVGLNNFFRGSYFFKMKSTMLTKMLNL